MRKTELTTRGGQVILATVLAVIMAATVMVGGLAWPVVREFKAAREVYQSRASFFAAESGLEDASFRIKRGLPYLSAYTLAVGSNQAEIRIEGTGHLRTVQSVGEAATRFRQLESNLSLDETSAEFFYGVQVSDGGVQIANNARVLGNVYSNGNIIGSSSGSAFISGDAVVAGGLNYPPNVNFAAHNNDQLFANLNSQEDLAQPFVAPVSGVLSRVSVYLAKVGNPNTITLKIAANSATDGGTPGGTISGGSASVAAAGVGTTPSWVHVAFASPPTLVAGTKYWIVLDASTVSAINHWNWRKDNSTGESGSNTYKSWSNTARRWSSPGTGFLAHQVWIGGANTRIEKVTVGDANTGTARANQFESVVVHGASCPNSYCVVDNPPRAELPISDGTIQDWRDAALLGGTCAAPVCDAGGNYHLSNGASGSLGPLYVPGDLEVDNNATLTLTGTVWVRGNIDLSNNCRLNLDSGYSRNSGVLLADGKITVSNNCGLDGSGDPDSYLMLLSALDAPSEDAIVVDNGATGVIYYAGKGRIRFSNNAYAKEATAYGLTLDNGATVEYESGLANINFTSGPGASFELLDWYEY